MGSLERWTETELTIGKDYEMVIQHKHVNKQQRFQYDNITPKELSIN